MRIIKIKTASLRVDQSILTGESSPPLKTVDSISDPAAALTQKNNLLFCGTLVFNGTGIGVAIATGILSFNSLKVKE